MQLTKRPTLSSQERSILIMLLTNQSEGEVASALRVTRGSIQLSLQRLCRRLGVQDRHELTRTLLESGLTFIEQRLSEREIEMDASVHGVAAIPNVPDFDGFWMFGE